jgi:branched-chain amino acid transport system ATP-binding protein
VSEALLEVRGLSKHFEGVRALEGVSLEARAGQVLGVIGPNGSGKTTLINCITGFARPSSGEVRFGGRDITGRPAHRIANRGLVRTFQIMRPFTSMAAHQNLHVALHSPRARRHGGWRGGGRHGDRDTVALDLLEELGFERDSRVPYQRAGTLPTGYLKRLELGRCMALRPRMIICDEVFSGLSTAEVASMLPLMERLRDEGVGLIMVEHRLRALFQLAERVVVLDQGRAIAEGAPREVLEIPAVKSAYLGMPAEEPTATGSKGASS